MTAITLLINLRHMDDRSVKLTGECLPADLQLESGDELIALPGPLAYDLEAQLMEEAVLVQGSWELPLECECVRCLKRFGQTLRMDDWACHIPLEGDEKALIINDCVDLTPYLREDILLAFPQHPLCDVNCGGLITPRKDPDAGQPTGGNRAGEGSPWSALDKLEL